MTEHTSKLIALLENTGNVLLNESPSTFRVKFIDSQLIKSVLQEITSHAGAGLNLSLHMLHIKGFQSIPPVNIYLNNENGSFDEELLVGSLALYGLRKSSQDGGIGLHEVWNVTTVFKIAVQQKNWNGNSFTLTFVSQSELTEKAEFSFERIELRLDSRREVNFYS
ncbi:hypothetical protein [Fluviicola sp.]|uniref:DUF7868 domain-containing protein n=1 Tax=Fluviicola sp. TaxID=1917219 RepID=UPI002631F686|nr:hypothetical protein [Fluviicola sp.]